MTEETICLMEEALQKRKSREVYDQAQAILDQNEEDAQAWYYLMRSLEQVLPVEQYDAANELSCGENAIEYASERERESMAEQVYTFYLQKALSMLELGEKRLADTTQIGGFYQKVYYFDATNSSRLTWEEDYPFIEAVRATFTYALALFAAVPGELIREKTALQSLTGRLANQWQRTYSFLEMRYEFHGKRLSEKEIRKGLIWYGRLLRNVADAEERIKKPVSFNLKKWDQEEYLRLAREETKTDEEAKACE